MAPPPRHGRAPRPDEPPKPTLPPSSAPRPSPPGVPFAGAQTPAKLYEDALSRHERQDAAGAVVQLKNALQQDPRMLAAHVLLGRALLAPDDAIPVAVGKPVR